ncbi:hypothetical protein Q3G72_016012 [Acer saccharum]|nr:hypothetical protein Q3G72_016012 [Acer saccharum]
MDIESFSNRLAINGDVYDDVYCRLLPLTLLFLESSSLSRSHLMAMLATARIAFKCNDLNAMFTTVNFFNSIETPLHRVCSTEIFKIPNLVWVPTEQLYEMVAEMEMRVTGIDFGSTTSGICIGVIASDSKQPSRAGTCSHDRHWDNEANYTFVRAEIEKLEQDGNLAHKISTIVDETNSTRAAGAFLDARFLKLSNAEMILDKYPDIEVELGQYYMVDDQFDLHIFRGSLMDGDYAIAKDIRMMQFAKALGYDVTTGQDPNRYIEA